MARTYPVKKGVGTDPDTLAKHAKEVAGNAEVKGNHVVCSIPGIKVIEIFPEGKNLVVETENDSANSNPMETIRMFNDLIEAVTGFSSKERKKRLSKV